MEISMNPNLKIMNNCIYLVLIHTLLFYSCSSGKKKCEGFNFNRLNVNKNYFLKDLNYVNGNDTIQLFYKDVEVSKQFNIEPYSGIYVDCNPTFGFSHENESKSLQLSSYFNYSPYEDNKLKLSLYINFSHIELGLDTLNLEKRNIIFLGKKNNLFSGIKQTEIIKKIELEKYLITYIEKESGEVWRLVKVGDSIVDNVR